jgi:hypothetical protein
MELRILHLVSAAEHKRTNGAGVSRVFVFDSSAAATQTSADVVSSAFSPPCVMSSREDTGVMLHASERTHCYIVVAGIQ